MIKKTQKEKDIERQELDDLYQYIKKEIMLYDDNQALTPKMVLRLKGMREGKYLANNKTKIYANYPFSVILTAFKICKPSIMSAISLKSFDDEYGKFLYICAIVEREINDVYIRMKKVEETKTKIESMELNAIQSEGVEYSNRSDKNISNKLEDLW